ncbi:MAG TPA: thioredoxin domain-containing protein, partial [Leucothrix mucor]|nr:thioredoxin domain-containing protein [Leucothrix mucor]
MKYFLSLLLLLLTISTSAKTTENALKSHSSPYLAMHGNDPVNWMDWGKPALDKAKKENKLLFISIGYFACHWCHVMQRESYADKGIAKLLNKNYISVKVDRELNPVLDKRLIEFVQVTNGTAGWPLNVFLTPEGYPLVGATYMPREQFSSVLDQLDKKWKTDQATLESQAKEMSETLVSMLQTQEITTASHNNKSNKSNSSKNNAVEKTKTIQQLSDGFVKNAMKYADTMQGGFGQRRKFPQIPQLWALLKLNKTNKNTSTKKQADKF